VFRPIDVRNRKASAMERISAWGPTKTRLCTRTPLVPLDIVQAMAHRTTHLTLGVLGTIRRLKADTKPPMVCPKGRIITSMIPTGNRLDPMAERTKLRDMGVSSKIKDIPSRKLEDMVNERLVTGATRILFMNKGGTIMDVRRK